MAKNIQYSRGRYEVTGCGEYIGKYDSLLEATIARDKARGLRPKKTYERKIVRIEGFNDRLNEAVYKSNLDMSEIAKRSQISRTALQKYRYYGVTPKCDILARLAITLNVSTDWLLGLSKEKR